MELTHLLDQVFQEHGLLGVLILFVLTGPGYTWVKTRNLQVQVEDRARELVAEFARHERQRADRLEKQLNFTQNKLEKAQDEVDRLKDRLKQAQRELEEVPMLRKQINQLTSQVLELQQTLHIE